MLNCQKITFIDFSPTRAICSRDVSLYSWRALFIGLTGPRGRTGKPGHDGKHGIPGVSLYQAKTNGTATSELLIPPSIASKCESVEVQNVQSSLKKTFFSTL